MKWTFAGCGSAFTTSDYYQSNVVIEKNGKFFLIDCGSDIRFALAELGIKAADIDGVFITHAHADHLGGLEWLAFSTCFGPNPKRPKLYSMGHMLGDIWNKSLSGGLESIQGKINRLEDYFEPKPVHPNETFTWENIAFQPFQTTHVMNGFKLMDSYGLLLEDQDSEHRNRVLFTGDTQFAPSQLVDFYYLADTIFHDCETAPFQSRVHAHYDLLKTLSAELKAKIYLYHYQPNPPQDALVDGFRGFVKKGGNAMKKQKST